jgi:hypothetical protein
MLVCGWKEQEEERGGGERGKEKREEEKESTAFLPTKNSPGRVCQVFGESQGGTDPPVASRAK